MQPDRPLVLKYATEPGNGSPVSDTLGSLNLAVGELGDKAQGSLNRTMAEPERELETQELPLKFVVKVAVPQDVKNEIENLRRLTQTVHDRLHNLCKRVDNIVAS